MHHLYQSNLGFQLMLTVLLVLPACASSQDESANVTVDNPPAVVMSLLGSPLEPLTFPEERRAELEADLARARRDFNADPDDEMNIIWLGRRLAYLGRYFDAIAVYTDGIDKHPQSYRLLRHRGHRYITTRQLDKAVADLTRAAQLAEHHDDQVEPDGAPNDAGVPTSTTHTNIYYHLGLAHYLRGDFGQALRAYQTCLDYCRNNDITVATTYWVFLTARRTGQMDTALAALEPISPDMTLLENHDYHRLLMLYTGHVREGELLSRADGSNLSSSTLLYGIAMQRLINGDEPAARELFDRIIDTGFWPAFGYIAAEAELARMH